ncbi:MAG: hypothetical protein WD342_02000 [Verrucomicrobiales bacterium]
MSAPERRKYRTLRNIGASAPGANPAGVGDGKSAGPEEEGDGAPARVLVAHPVASTSRLVRETLESFTGSRVETSSNPLRAFELALQKPYRLFIFAMQMGEITGPMLYELISKAYTAGRGPKQLAPGVIFIREKDDAKLPEELSRDVRVKDVLTKPLRIERLLQPVAGVLEVRDPTTGT